MGLSGVEHRAPEVPNIRIFLGNILVGSTVREQSAPLGFHSCFHCVSEIPVFYMCLFMFMCAYIIESKLGVEFYYYDNKTDFFVCLVSFSRWLLFLSRKPFAF